MKFCKVCNEHIRLLAHKAMPGTTKLKVKLIDIEDYDQMWEGVGCSICRTLADLSVSVDPDDSERFILNIGPKRLKPEPYKSGDPIY